MPDQEVVDVQELKRRRRELQERKYSFIELIMQVRKKMHRDRWQKEQERS